jgi:hypothetical protein
MSVLEKLAQARAELEAHQADPWRAKLQDALHGVEAISTYALLDLLRAPASTGTARRLAAVMRSLKFVPMKSRRFFPGGRAGNTVTRGWARPVRDLKSSPKMRNAGPAGLSPEGMIT